MRFVLGSLAILLAAAPAGAVTIFTGVAETASDGSRFINFDVNLKDFMPQGTAAHVSFKVDGGTLLDGNAQVLNGFNYYYFVDHPPFDEGNDLTNFSLCTFGGGTNCTNFPDPQLDSFNPYHTEFISNFAASSTGLSYTATTLREFGTVASDFSSCVPAVFDSVCAVKGLFTLNTIFARVKGDGPISYTVAFSDPVAVPEASPWAMMVAGFGALGATARRKKRRALAHS
jgi:hypothetical protein